MPHSDGVCSVLLTAHSCETGTIEIARVVRVHGRVDAQVFQVVERFAIGERIRGLRHHFAHIICLFVQKRVHLASPAKVATLLAPERARVIPLKGFLARNIAHAAIVVAIVSQACRHIPVITINYKQS